MKEKLEKALKSSKQGIWIILILQVVLNVLVLVSLKNILYYVKEAWVSLIFISSLVTGLVLYSKGKYRQGAEVVQWAALGNLILAFTQTIAVCVITKTMEINVVSLLLGAFIPIILVVEALKVIRLSEQPKQSNKITIVAVIIIALVAISQIILINNEYKVIKDIMDSMDEIGDILDNDNNEETTDEQGNDEVNFEQILDTIILELGYKEELDSLPELNDDEKIKYEKEWNDFVKEERDGFVKDVKNKYPALSDKQVQDYVTQVFKFLKEYGPRLAKHNQEIIDKANQAVESTDLSQAQSLANIVWAEAYITDKRGDALVTEVQNRLLERDFDFDKYTVIVTDSGIEVKIK